MKPNCTAYRLTNFINISKVVTIYRFEFSNNFHFDGEKHNDEFHAISTDEKHTAEVFVISFTTSSASMNFFKSKIIQLPEKLKNKMFSLIQECIDVFESYIPCDKLEIKNSSPVVCFSLITNTTSLGCSKR